MRLAVAPEGAGACARTRRLPLPTWVAAAVLGLAACRQEEVTHFRVAKEAPSPGAMMAGDMAGSRGGGTAPAPGAGDVPPPPTVAGPSLKWTLPRGWSQSVGGGGMRYATLTPPASGRIDGSVVVLPGPAGGELANVNRWRGQIGLAALDEGGLAAARKVLKTRAGAVNVYDFTSEGQKRSRLVAGLTSAEGNTWFVKLTGDADAVGSAEPAFVHLLESLRFE